MIPHGSMRFVPTHAPTQPRLVPFDTARSHARFGWLIWGVFALGLCIATVLKPDAFVLTDGERFDGRVVGATERALVVVRDDQRQRGPQTIDRSAIAQHAPLGGRSVTPEYRRAAELWWQSKPMYTQGVHGFLYLPQGAILYSPFTLLPPALEETLWRIVGLALLALGLRRVCEPLFAERWPTAFLWSSALAIPPALGSAANGQTNIHIAGLFALACADVIGRRWWRVAMWLSLALACKPTAIVMVLLVGAIYPRPMGWRLTLALLVLAAAPFLHLHPEYVVEQYRAFLGKVAAASAPPDLFPDIRGLLVSFGVVLSEDVLRIVRAAAALGTLGLCWLASRRFGGVGCAMALWTLGGVYLTLFNPRTEGLTYVLLGVPGALWATREVLARRWAPAAFLIFFCLATQFSTQIALNHKNYWVRPLGAAIFAAMVAIEIARGRSRWPADCQPDTTPSR